jgi:hypothetical protein
MSNYFLNSNRLATLSEVEFLLFTVLKYEKGCHQIEVEQKCKEYSFNFLHSYENTLQFLEAISVIKIHNNIIFRNETLDFNSLLDKQELALFCLSKLLFLLTTLGQSKDVFNEHVIYREAEAIVIRSLKIPKQLTLLKYFLLNFRIVEVDEEDNKEYYVLDDFKFFFIKEWAKYFSEIKHNVNFYGKPKKLFVSFATKDDAYRAELKNHLNGMVRKEYITYWDGRMIPPSQKWDEKIKEQLDQSDAIVILLSADAIASNYINTVEFAKAKERADKGEAIIIPVLVRDCDFESSPYYQINLLPRNKKVKAISSWKNKDAAYVNVVKGIKMALGIEQSYS